MQSPSADIVVFHQRKDLRLIHIPGIKRHMHDFLDIPDKSRAPEIGVIVRRVSSYGIVVSEGIGILKTGFTVGNNSFLHFLG